MRKTQASVLACVLLLSLGLAKAALAQEPAKVAGVWELSMEGRRGTMTQTLTIRQDGGKITGTLKGRGNRTFHLEGTVKGDRISFTVNRQTRRGTFTITYAGTVDADAMKGTATMGMRRFTLNWTAKRQQ